MKGVARENHRDSCNMAREEKLLIEQHPRLDAALARGEGEGVDFGQFWCNLREI